MSSPKIHKAVLLAAGKGTRMNSRLPKVLQPLAGKPLLAHVLAQAARVEAERIITVYGHGGDAVQAAFACSSHTQIEWVEQAEQKGTGHAVAVTLPVLPTTPLPATLFATRLRACPACLPACVPACLPICLPARPPARPPPLARPRARMRATRGNAKTGTP